MAVRYLVLSGELSGEGVWCCATTYDGLVARVREVWGDGFDPIFKYPLASSLPGGEEDLRYYRAANPFRYTAAAAAAASPDAHGGGAEPEKTEETPAAVDCLALSHGRGATQGRCLVMLSDNRDFQLWLHGRQTLLADTPEHMSSCDPLHNAIYHASPTGTRGGVGPLTAKLFAFHRTATQQSAPTGRPPCDAVGATRTVTRPSLDNVTSSSHPYYNSVGAATGVFRMRSSPAVKGADTDSPDIVRPPMHTLLSPLVLLRLGVRVVLRHSNASEVILYSASHNHTADAHAASMANSGRVSVGFGCLTAGEGSGLWGELVQRARSAWGVHRPVFRYLDLSQGYSQITVTNVVDLRIWAETVGPVNPELLVLEQAPAVEGAAPAADAVDGSSPLQGSTEEEDNGDGDGAAAHIALSVECNAETVRRFRAAQPPVNVRYDEDVHRGVHLRTLMKRLEELEREDLQRRVDRPLALPSRVTAGRPLSDAPRRIDKADEAGESLLPAVAAPSTIEDTTEANTRPPTRGQPAGRALTAEPPRTPEGALSGIRASSALAQFQFFGGLFANQKARAARGSPTPSLPPVAAVEKAGRAGGDGGFTSSSAPPPDESRAEESTVAGSSLWGATVFVGVPPDAERAQTTALAEDTERGRDDTGAAAALPQTRPPSGTATVAIPKPASDEHLPAIDDSSARGRGQYSQEAAYVTSSIAAGAYGPHFSLRGKLSCGRGPSLDDSPEAATAEGAEEQQAAAAAHHRRLADRFQLQFRLAQR